jgi:hypothetical protein
VRLNSVAQRIQVYGDNGSLIIVSFQLAPPSVLTSTFDIPRSPAKATPAMVSSRQLQYLKLLGF